MGHVTTSHDRLYIPSYYVKLCNYDKNMSQYECHWIVGDVSFILVYGSQEITAYWLSYSVL